MIRLANLHGLVKPQVLGVVSSGIIPACTDLTFGAVVVPGVRPLASEFSAHVGRWTVSGPRAWRVVRREVVGVDRVVLGAFYTVRSEQWIDAPLLPDQEYIADFVITDLPELDDHGFVQCNLSQPAPVDDGGVKRGVRLFPGDDRPRTFTRCNLVNCEPPPGSTVTKCNTTIRESGVADRDDNVTIDGQTATLRHYKSVVHGRWDPGTESYEYNVPPVEIPEE